MPATKTIDNSADVIDSRDVIERIEALREEIEADEISVENGAEEQFDDDGNVRVDTCTCGECGKTWNDALISERTPAPSARCPYEALHEEIAELKALEALAEEAEGYAPDWTHGETLIRDSYFTDYAKDLLEDCGDLPRDLPWYVVIDWEATAGHIQQDYTSVDFDGVTYWIR